MVLTPTTNPPGPLRVLVLTDQRLVAQMIKLTLNHGAFDCQSIERPPEAVALLKDWRPHLAIVDMDLDHSLIMNELTRDQAPHPATPVIALTRRGDLQSKLDAFAEGVDDIMVVPFSPEELLARTLAISKRAYGRAQSFNPVLHLGDMDIDIVHRAVTVDGHALHMSGLELALLYLLAANSGTLVTRDQILDALWGPDFVAESNIVDRHIRNLRVRLQNSWKHPRFIATIAGKGYRFLPQLDPEEAATIAKAAPPPAVRSRVT